jgi:hypothetical protein
LKKKIVNTVKFVAFISIGLFLFWKVYKDQPVEDLIVAAKNVNYWWIALVSIIGISSHLVRALRWEIILSSMGIKTYKDNLFYAVMVGYLANLAIPRMGEVSRSAVLKKYNKVPFTTGFGTIVTERIVDVVIMLGLTFFVVLFHKDVILEFLRNNPAVSDNARNLLCTRNLVIMGVMGVLAIAGYLFLLARSKKSENILTKIFGKLNAFKEGLFSIFKVKRPVLYLFYSLLIWFLYYLMMYFSFPAFSFAGNIGFTANEILVVFLMGSYAMLAPVQGGIGAYHFMVISTLIIYGVDDADARLFALIVHGINTIVIMVVGFFSLAMLPIANRNRTFTEQ